MTIPEHNFLMKVLCGDGHAVRFCEMLFTVSQTLDDLVDRDKPRTDTDIIRAFHIALIALPENPFYRNHFDYLRPMLAMALQAYTDSVALEKSGAPHALSLAFVLRDRLTDVVIQCARLTAGWEHAQRIAEEVQLYFQDETLTQYKAGHLEVEQ